MVIGGRKIIIPKRRTGGRMSMAGLYHHRNGRDTKRRHTSMRIPGTESVRGSVIRDVMKRRSTLERGLRLLISTRGIQTYRRESSWIMIVATALGTCHLHQLVTVIPQCPLTDSHTRLHLHYMVLRRNPLQAGIPMLNQRNGNTRNRTRKSHTQGGQRVHHMADDLQALRRHTEERRRTPAHAIRLMEETTQGPRRGTSSPSNLELDPAENPHLGLGWLHGCTPCLYLPVIMAVLH